MHVPLLIISSHDAPSEFQPYKPWRSAPRPCQQDQDGRCVKVTIDHTTPHHASRSEGALRHRPWAQSRSRTFISSISRKVSARSKHKTPIFHPTPHPPRTRQLNAMPLPHIGHSRPRHHLSRRKAPANTLSQQKTTPLARATRISRSKGRLSKRTAFVRDIVKEVAGLAPYERRVIELLRNSKDKRARKLAKKRVCFPSVSCHFLEVVVGAIRGKEMGWYRKARGVDNTGTGLYMDDGARSGLIDRVRTQAN